MGVNRFTLVEQKQGKKFVSTLHYPYRWQKLLFQFIMNPRNILRRFSRTVQSSPKKHRINQKIQSIAFSSSESKIESHNLKNAWNLIADVYNEFARQSSIHGIKHTRRTKTLPERIFWLFIIILSMIAAGILAQKFYFRHKGSNMRTMVMTHQYPSWKTPLPAITICHPSVASRARLEKYQQGAKKLSLPFGLSWDQFLLDLQYLQEILIPTNHVEDAMFNLNWLVSHNNLTIEQFFSIVSPSCDDYIILCRWEEEMKPCSQLLKRSLTPYGLCCSVNYAYVDGQRRWAEEEAAYSALFGHNYILSVLLKDLSPQDRISGLTYGDGARVIIHDRYSYPGPSSREFIASQGSEMIAYLEGHILKASDEVLNMPRSERDCRWMPWSGSEVYKVDNCLAECRENMYRSYCDCAPFYSSTLEANDTACDFSHVACMAKVKARVLQTSIRGPPCFCLPNCHGTSWALSTTVVPMNAVQFNPSQFYHVARKYPNATAIHLTFTRQTSLLLRRDLVLSWINLISSLGGVFSLFLGCSLISVIEIIYFIVYYFYKVTKNRAMNLRRVQNLF